MSKLYVNRILLLIFSLTSLWNTVDAQNNATISWREALLQEERWYSSDEAIRIADNVVLYQNNNGGWLKNIDMAGPLNDVQKNQLRKDKLRETGTTIDNGATHTQMSYLAKVYSATKIENYKTSFLKGLDYLLAAQYENGGWPQFYPIRKGYYEHITLNDDAMIGVMDLLKRISKKEKPYDFVEVEKRNKAKAAIEKGLQVLLKMQVVVDGKKTVWSAQHHKITLLPAKARAYELPSLSGKESVNVVQYLMEIKNPTEEVINAICSAIAWFEENKLTGLKVEWVQDKDKPRGRDRIVVQEAEAGALWARFYEIGTNKPMFVGRDGKVKDKLEDIEHERRVNYSYLGDYAKKLLEYNFPEWEKKIAIKENIKAEKVKQNK